MSEWMKWNIRFTAFVPLWVSIIIEEAFSIKKQYQEYQGMLVEYGDMPFVKEDFIVMCSIELIVIGILLLGSFVGILALLLSIWRYDRSKDRIRYGEIVWAKQANRMVLELLIAYILPLAAFDFSDVKDILLFLIYFWIICIYCIQNDYYFVNILLGWKGYHMYQCDITCESNGKEQTYYGVLVLSRRNLAVSSIGEITYKGNDRGIFLDL